MTTHTVAGFTGGDRRLGDEDLLHLTSVGVDIGSATTHLVFSRLDLERVDTRYVTVGRTILAESEILLTPYRDQTAIDGDALERFIHQQYEQAGLGRDDVDTGALILTGVALLRENARAIADVFAQETGRFVAVSAGDNLETLMAAHGSGALDLSASTGQTIVNVDIGGGTSKIAVCDHGQPVSLAALDVGARLLVRDQQGRIERLEPAGRETGLAVGLDLSLGRPTNDDEMRLIAGYMADRVLTCVRGLPLTEADQRLLRTTAPHIPSHVDGLSFSGGVSEFLYGRQPREFGDLGSFLADALRQRIRDAGLRLVELPTGIRATVIGASQYTVQVSGTTIFLSEPDALPVRNVPVLAPVLALSDSVLDATAIATAVKGALDRLDLTAGHDPVALAVAWDGSATYGRIDAFCRGVADGLRPVLDLGHPLVLVFARDVGGLFGLHLRESLGVRVPIISIDGVDVEEFDYIDIGAMIPTSGAVPVVIKSLVFPNRLAASQTAAQ